MQLVSLTANSQCTCIWWVSCITESGSWALSALHVRLLPWSSTLASIRTRDRLMLLSRNTCGGQGKAVSHFRN